MRLLILTLCLTVIAGCASFGSGETISEPVINEKTGKVQTNAYGITVKKKNRSSKTSNISEDTKEAAIAASKRPQLDPCAALKGQKPDSAAGEAELYRSLSDCARNYMLTQMFAYSHKRPTTPEGEVMEQGQRMIAASENATSKNIDSTVKPFVAGVTITKVSEHRADVAKSRGNVTANVDTGSASQHSSGGGHGGAGEELAGGEGGGSSNSRGNTTTNVIIASDNTDVATGHDSSTAQNGINQQLEPSSNGTVINRSDQSTDDNSGDSTAQDDDGLNL